MNTEQFDGHTPGPWNVNDEVGLVIKHGDGAHDFVDMENGANARLMAAAPDLLAEVKRWQPITQGCDLARLKQQKQMLLAMIWEDHDHELWGLVNLLDALQDLLEGEEVIA